MNDAYPICACPLPALLREIPDAPKTLYLRGTLPHTNTKLLTVVGARKYTPYGKQVCEKLITGLTGFPISIISGLALGIDGIAHTSALKAGLHTIAVPGSGLDDQVLYPKTHKQLAHNILDAGGALLSEFEPMHRARPESFPQRNRIMAGMSHAVLVVEAELRSGTLITSRLATEYNRDVCTVPGPIHASTSQGPHMLIRTGATLIRDSADILEVLGVEPGARAYATEPVLDQRESIVHELLKDAPLPRDVVIKQLGMSTSEANMLLAALELKGLITEQLGVILWK